ncbi:MAG: glycoside hydrolase family 97 protein [Sedimentisphaerales bacterium]|nr:glycoside hydrolase family 97 protein [Sedimentisphaerales bacterium]
MRFNFIICALFFSIYMGSLCWASSSVTIFSPNGQVKIFLALADNGIPTYRVLFQGREVIKSSNLGLVFQKTGPLAVNLALGEIARRNIDETYPVLLGKTGMARNYCNEGSVELMEIDGAQRRMRLVFRAYDDGAAFRYEILPPPGAQDGDAFVLTDELTTFSFPAGAAVVYQPLPGFYTSFENLYQQKPAATITKDMLLTLPILLEIKTAKPVWAALTEAALVDYAGMEVSGTEGRPGTLISKLAPWPGREPVKVKGRYPHVSPWRVIMLADEPGRLLESNIIRNLNAPCAIEDTSWIKPGKTTWHWWNDTVAENVNFTPGMNTATMKYYIDFAAVNGIDFHALVFDDKNRIWYGTFDDNLTQEDVTSVIPELDMPEILRYAQSKGVGIRLWVHWQNLAPRLEEAFSLYEKWGIKGLMIDFMNRDDQEMVNFCRQVLECAARHHLKIQFHGVNKPTGLERTWPNLVNMEGSHNLEFLKWTNTPDPEHNLTVPFTRMLAGSMDYHLGGFRSIRREDFKPVNHAPVVMGTRCHHLAMYVVYENPVPMICDYPTAYENQKGFEFILEVPTVWDETRVLAAKPCDYLVIARRKGEAWYIGGMTDWTARSLKIPLSFLAPGQYTLKQYTDTAETDKDPNVLAVETKRCKTSDILTLPMASGGGFAAIITPAGK